MRMEQDKDIVISGAKNEIIQGYKVSSGQLKSVSKLLRVEDRILTKSGRPVVPPSMRKCVITEYHNKGHGASEKLFSIMQSRFYWP